MEEINHFCHEEHPLKLINGETIVGVGFKIGDNEEKPEPVGCFACVKPISPKHPLKLINGETIVGVGFKIGDNEEKPEPVGCFACVKPISPSDSAYACTQCRFFLHKSCAELPLTINLPSIYQHPLKLFNLRTTRSKYFNCDVCRLDHLIHGLCYSPNDEAGIFTACISCCVVEISQKSEADAIKKEAMVKFEHEGHPEHTLTLQLRPASFRCDACHTKDEGLFYQCDSCDFWIHKTCTSLASTLDLPHHPNHPLVLVYSLPEKFYKYAFYCEFCNIYIRRNEWLYHCGNCRYFAHIKCALNAPPPSTPRDRPSTSGANEDANDLLHFPMPYAFTDPLKLLHLNKLSLGDNDEVEIKHWSHHHPLILNVEPQHNNMASTSDSIEVCYGCIRPLSFPYYSCKDGCSFNLHKYCAHLPRTLKHQLHPDHSLDLVDTSGHKYFYRCTGCYSYGNTFVYRCETCDFRLCPNCAYLPNIIIHKTHNHPLIQVIDPQPLCKACNRWNTCISYVCKACGFQLCMYCAMRSPQSFAHRYCKGHDEVLLTYPPVENHPEDFYCDICEEEMHPKRPLYHCHNHKSRSSFHLRCISRIDWYANIWAKGTRNDSYHKHPLTFVRRKKSPRLEYVISLFALGVMCVS
ncbi:C1-like protein [Artemisia annua]|uniref:C1-like protein n=1 Tax=Artemisia annua TaxID=35608 RepID=A0A2U1LG35_ARTAN|nr:C1-like protein [Artemisia annua]